MTRAFAVALAMALLVGCQPSPQGPATPPPTAALTLPPPAQRTGPVGSAQRPLVMALLPAQDSARAAASGRAIATALEKATSLQWEVKVPTSYSTTIEGMCAGETDIAWLAPLAVVTARSKNCGEPLLGSLRNDPLAGRASVTYQLQVLARTGGGISSLKDRKGKKVALVERASAPGSLAVMAQIRKDTGEDPRTFFSQTVYAGDDEKAVLAVYQGQVDAAVSSVDARDLMVKTFPDVKQRTTRVATIGPVPNEGISSRRGLPADVRDKVEKALIDYSKTDEGKKALKALYPIDGLDKIDAKLYDPLLDAARLVGVDLDREAAATARPVPSPAKP
jgi:phosphonate transport system substrate-binding protein